MAADTPDPERTLNAFVNAFYSDIDGMLAGVYGEENINYTLNGNEIINTWTGDFEEKFKKNINIIQQRYDLLYEKEITLAQSFLKGKVGQIGILNKYFDDNTVIIDLYMPLHSNFRKVQTNFTTALNDFINNPESINIDDFIENYNNNAKAAGFEDILEDMNNDFGVISKYNYH
jgi:hypothetical protein